LKIVGATEILFSMGKAKRIPYWFRRAEAMAQEAWSHMKWGDFTRSAVYLSNPSEQRKLDRYLTKVVWPATAEAISGTRFRFLGQFRTCEKWYVRACREASLVFEDPEHPLNPGDYPPWYARLTIEYDVLGTLRFGKYVSLSPPLNCHWSVLNDILTETSDHGIPSQLSAHTDLGHYTIVFEGGGTGKASDLPLTRAMKMRILAYCEFMETARELNENWSDPLVRRRVIREINNVLEI
jgi:hypothetical protein